MQGQYPQKKVKRIKQCVQQITNYQHQFQAEQQRFKLYMESGQIHYLDSNKTLALVTALYLSQLQQKFKKVKEKLAETNSDLKFFEIQNKIWQKQKQILKQNNDGLQQTLNQQRQFSIDLNKQLQQYKKKALQTKHIQRQLIQKVNIIRIPKIEKVYENKQSQNTQVQTEQWMPTITINKKVYNQEIIIQKPRENVEIKLEQILNMFEVQLNGIVKNLNSKINELQKQNLNIKDWIEKYNQVALQNKTLKQKIQSINLQQQKINYWKIAVQSQMKQIQQLSRSTIMPPVVSTIIIQSKQNNDPITLQIQNSHLKKQILRLRNQILQKQINRNQMVQQRIEIGEQQEELIKMQKEQGEIEQQNIMLEVAKSEKNYEQQYEKFKQNLLTLDTGNEQDLHHEDDGIIKKILNLSQKIKLIVEFITNDIQ